MANPYAKQTWTDGASALSAARLGVIETGIYDAHFQPAARAFHSANQSIPNATLTTLAFNSESTDQDGLGTSTIHDNVTNNSRLTCRVAGFYGIVANIVFASNVTGIRLVGLYVNGASVVEVNANTTGGGFDSKLALPYMTALAVNDYVEVYVYQTSTGALNVLAGSSVEMARLG